MEQKEEPGRVQLKTILKGSAAQSLKSAAASGFKVADFQINPAIKESTEDALKNEIAVLNSQLAALKGEIATLKKNMEQESKASFDKGVQNGKTQGIAEGEKKATEKYTKDLKQIQDNATKTFESIETQQKEMFEKISAETAEIAIAIAKRVFCEEAAQNPNIIAKIIKEAFTFLGQEEKIKIRLNPLDILLAEEKESFWKPSISSLKNIELISDETIEKGGCLLEAENGSSIDMRVQTIFRHIEEYVKRLYSN